MTLAADIRLGQGGFTLSACFTAPSDGVTALFGPSGSGKSTLLAALAGLKKAQGRISLRGRERQNIPPHRRGFGLVFQEARLFPHLTVGENIAYARKRAPATAGLGPEEAARLFDIAGLMERPVHNLSGGEKARVALARALASGPDFLLLDEPFAALDGARRRAFIQVLLAAHARTGLPMLVVTHNIDDAAALATHLVALDQGKVVAQGGFGEASRQPAFQALLDERDMGAVLPASALAGARGEGGHGVWLRADHVLLAAEAPQAISARNILEGRITGLRTEAAAVLVELETRAGTILARITPEAAAQLQLGPSKPAWAVIKAHAV